MGERARLNYLRRTTPGERFDDGLLLCDAMAKAVLARAGIQEDGTPESARRAFRALRLAGE